MDLILFIGNIGTSGAIVIVLALLLLFGGKKIPQLMKGLGEGMKEFKNASNKTNKDNKGEK